MLVASDLGAARVSTGTGLAVAGGRRQAQSAGPWRCRSLPARWRVAGSPWSAITARIWPCQPSAEDRASFSWCGYRDPPEAASEPPGTRASRVGGATNCRAVSRHDDEVPRTLSVRRACARETAGNAQEGLVRNRPHHRDRPSCPSRRLEGTGGCSREMNRGSGEATDPRSPITSRSSMSSSIGWTTTAQSARTPKSDSDSSPPSTSAAHRPERARDRHHVDLRRFERTRLRRLDQARTPESVLRDGGRHGHDP